jgi:hypothetical protein
MKKPTAGKNKKTSSKSIPDTGKKKWQSPELTEVDYDKTNGNFSGYSGSDGLYYS